MGDPFFPCENGGWFTVSSGWVRVTRSGVSNICDLLLKGPLTRKQA